ncbi:MAG: cytochrome C [Planctomycetia bacterium]|nr:cytochrome C [Planctomycetia bacterium]
MPQIFHRAFNTISVVSILGVAVLAGLTGGGLYLLVRSPYTTGVGVTRDQPIPFSHAHHVNELGIDCRYCHTSVEDSSYASVPPTKTCMNCHSQIWVGSEMLAPVRESYRTDTSIEWNRVHRVAEFCYFNHSIHIKKGIGCVSCHGRIDHMHLVRQQNTLLMEWCLDCHRQPEKYVRPRDQIYNMNFKPQDAGYKNQEEMGKALVEKYEIRSKTSCSACHR